MTSLFDVSLRPSESTDQEISEALLGSVHSEGEVPKVPFPTVQKPGCGSETLQAWLTPRGIAERELKRLDLEELKDGGSKNGCSRYRIVRQLTRSGRTRHSAFPPGLRQQIGRESPYLLKRSWA
jgi:hypothetical protein